MIEVSPAPYADGAAQLNGLVAVDTAKSGKRPGVLVFYEAPGMADHPRRRINMLAELGYVGFAADVFGDGQVLMGDPATTRLQKFFQTPGLMRSRVLASYQAIKARPDVDPDRIGVIGYCMGGTCMLELARAGAEFAGGVGFHSGLAPRTDTAPGTVKAKLLVCIGNADPLIPPNDVAAFQKEMSGAKADYQIVTYGDVGHSFTNKDIPPGWREGFSYHEASDRRSWIAMRDFFNEVFA